MIPKVREAAESKAAEFESRAAPYLRDLPALWPLTATDEESPAWATACFIALHVLRNPSGLDHMLRAQRAVLDQRMPHYRKQTNKPGQQESFLREVTSDGFRASRVLESVMTLASVLASMHWTLLQFDGPLLATSDQPVTFVPLLTPGSSAPVTAIPRGSLLDCEEVRFATDPQRALLLTWLNEPSTDPVLRGSDAIAAQLNRAVIAQADRQWFHQTRPPACNDHAAVASHGSRLLAGQPRISTPATTRQRRGLPDDAGRPQGASSGRSRTAANT